jgi:hypothetical protein
MRWGPQHDVRRQDGPARRELAGPGDNGTDAAFCEPRDAAVRVTFPSDPRSLMPGRTGTGPLWLSSGAALPAPRGPLRFAALLPNAHKSAAQARRFDVLRLMPPFITDRSSREGDEKFVTLTCRRPVVEYAVASAAAGPLDARPRHSDVVRVHQR